MIKKRLLRLLAALAAVTTLGAVGLHLVERWGWLDSLYATVITLGTVGYGDFTPKTPSGKVLVMALVVGGLGLLSYTLVEITSFIVEGHLSRMIRTRSAEGKIRRMRGHYIVCGLDGTGLHVAEELAKNRLPFVAVDRDQAKLDHPLLAAAPHILADAGDDETMRRAGIERARGVAACLASDEANLFLAFTAKGLNPAVRVVARLKHPSSRPKLQKAGADAVVAPSIIGGLRMASELTRPAVVSFLDLMLRESKAMRFEEAEVGPHSPWAGKPLSALRLMESLGLNVVAIRDAQKAFHYNPLPGHILKPHDTLVVISDPPRLARLKKMLA